MSTELYWAAAGIGLIIADVIFGTFFVLFLGASALVTALLVWTGLLPDPALQWLVFAIVAAAGVLLFRKKLLKSFGPGHGSNFNEHLGQQVVVSSHIPANGQGRVSYRGTEWPASTMDGSALEEGAKGIVRHTDGILLKIEQV
ncbi:MAG: NfeD family protein [Bacteroidetes bacterium]|nr:NfeD family protein [Bacteroidota bacterium]